jgi:hypothetical protein
VRHAGEMDCHVHLLSSGAADDVIDGTLLDDEAVALMKQRGTYDVPRSWLPPSILTLGARPAVCRRMPCRNRTW